MGMERVSVVFICDDNYVIPTSVAISSMIKNKKDDTYYQVYVIASELKDENIIKLKSLKQEDVNIEIVEASRDGLKQLHSFSSDAICVASIDALLKFYLSELLPEEEKVLYLDGDILVLQDLAELYSMDLEDYYVGAVVDSGSLYYKHKFVQKVENYFNSGVMLLNLRMFRKLDMKKVLIEEKIRQEDSSLMDQNVFNIVFDSHIKLLPIKYNFLAISLLRAKGKWTIDDINGRYGTTYKEFKDIEEDAHILHFSSKDKPWRVSDIYGADLWYKYYLQIAKDNSVDRQMLTCLKSSDSEKVLVSIIIPVYNSSEYLDECLLSALCQTLNPIEVICVDDGSTDNSLEILHKYKNLDKRIRIIVQPNSGQSVARNRAIREASGEFVYFLDSDDLIKSNAMEELYEVAQKNDLDTLLFDGTSFYETDELEEKFPNYKTYYNHKKEYKGIHNGRKLYSIMRNQGDLKVSPCLHFMKRTNILENDIWYPEGIIHEDNYFAFLALMESDRVMCIKKTYFLRRVRNDSTMTKKITNGNIIGYYVCAKKILEYLSEHKLEDEVVLNASTQVYRHMLNVNKMIGEIDDESQLKALIADERMDKLDYSLFLPILYIFTRVVNKRELDAEKAVNTKQSIEISKLKKELNSLKSTNKKQKSELEKLKNINLNKGLVRKSKKVVKIGIRKVKTCIRCFKKGGIKKVVTVILEKLKK